MLTRPLALLLFVLLAASVNGYAQDTVFRFTCRADRGSDVVSSHILADPARGTLCLVLEMERHQRYIKLDSQLHVLDQFEEDKNPESNMFLLDRARLVGTSFIGNTFQYYFTIQSPRRAEVLYAKEIDFTSHSTKEEPRLNVEERVVRLGFFLDSEGKPYLLSTPLQGATLYLDRTGPGGEQIRDSIATPNMHHPALDLGYIHFVPSESPQRLENNATSTLAFTRGHQLLLVTQVHNHEPQVAIIDLQTFQAHSKQLSTRRAFNDLDTTQPFSIAASVLDNRFFVVKATSDKTEIGIFQIPTMDKVGDLILNAANPHSLAQAPLLFNTAGVFLRKTGIYDYPANMFFQDLIFNRMALAVNKDKQGRYELTFGYVFDPWRRYDQFSRPFFYLGHVGLTDIPNRYKDEDLSGQVLGIDPSLASSEDRQRITRNMPLYPGKLYFQAGFAKVVLDPQSFNAVKAPTVVDAEETLWNVLSIGTPTLSPMKRFSINGQPCAGAFNKVTRTYVIWKIPKNSP